MDLPGPVSGLAPSAVADAMTAARASGLLTSADGRLAFRHALVRELVLAQLDLATGPGCAAVRPRRWKPQARAPVSSPSGWVNCGFRPGSRGERWRPCAGRAGRHGPRVRSRPPRRWCAGRWRWRRPNLADAARLELLELLAVAGREPMSCLW